MDQSKWAIPRSKVLTKNLAKYERPKGKIQGIWVHNICLCLFVVDPRVHCDASMVIETLCRSLEHAKKICDRLQVDMPKRLLLWVTCQEVEIVYFTKKFQMAMGNMWKLIRLLEFMLKLLRPTKGDNTVRENKNNSVMRWLCWILLQKGYEFTGITMARVGHTHSSLGTLGDLKDSSWFRDYDLLLVLDVYVSRLGRVGMPVLGGFD